MREKVFMDRYSLKDESGNPTEKYPEQMWRRVAAGIAQVEKTKKKRKEFTVKFYDILKDFKFVAGGRILSGAGTPYEVTFYNCFVIPSPHDSRDGILDNLKVMVDIFSRSGGAGVNISSLRPRGARVKKVNGTSSGPVNWAALYSTATHDVIQQGGTRRGALMLMLNDWHPDVVEFIEVKKDLTRINGANLSICISDKFMEAVKEDKNWDLVFPDIDEPDYDKIWDGNLENWIALGKNVKVYKTVRAREIWDKICQAAWESAEPGIYFMERANKQSNTGYFEKLICTNPCGEQPLGPWAVCNLGSINLTKFVKDGKMDYEFLEDTVRKAVRFMDNVIDATGYYYKENEETQLDTRRIGLGTLGLGDALILMGLRYGSDESISVVHKIYKIIRDAVYDASADLAIEKGIFQKFDKEKYLQRPFIKKLPESIRSKIVKNGIRNSVLLTQAPTGSTSLFSDVSSGIEPVFDFTMIRRDRIGEHIIYHPLYKKWQEEHPGESHPDYFVSANELTPEEHVKMQAAIQEYTDASISKTVNAPNTHSVEDVKKLYNLAYELGCKGITYMRDGSREGVLSHAESEKKTKEVEQKQPTKVSTPNINYPVHLRKRPDYLQGITRRIATPVGHAFVTINADSEGNPFEVFITVGKAGSDIAADAEAIGRLVSLALRIPSGYSPKEVARQIVNQLTGIGGSSQRGFGMDRVYSLADAVSKVLSEYLSEQGLRPILETGENGNGNGKIETEKEEKPVEIKEPMVVQPAVSTKSLKIETRRDICPKCGVAAFVYEEGCKKCYSCGNSEC
ncbi:MAG: ribonucleoside-diphosphate reductase, adenosylcobalamin-dependent [Candidatus Woykebacteria bacterium RBG_13_40_15]|uniref:Vitamin B12-dependent ribonucleotide reductase n=1 Tax=Candidatus Woykebacteria bacterium RBG_13_40_15 TaxID=1802593 RepID=A0A1G1W5R6_9BACT|nr:MAG: ribonucleoside-diphosphate reductase, adenosylcobalamin-dependent [Candidatus Woykebacteria bacterium RBG_13_40_15]